MKKLLTILASFITLISCNNLPSIPEGSLYQKGDIVYKIDNAIYENHTIVCDADFIYRKNYILTSNNITNEIKQLDLSYSIIIEDDYLIIPQIKDLKYHISQKISY
jgi:hypothetical protein